MECVWARLEVELETLFIRTDNLESVLRYT